MNIDLQEMDMDAVQPKENNIKKKKKIMVLAVVKLIFFVEADSMLCFGFWMKIVVITHPCFSCCRVVITQSQGLLLVLLHCQQRG